MQAEVVRQVLSLAHQSVKETHRDRLESYIRAYCRAIPPEVLSEVEPHHLLAFVMDRFAFLEEDFARTVKVAIHDPETTLLHRRDAVDGDRDPAARLRVHHPDDQVVPAPEGAPAPVRAPPDPRRGPRPRPDHRHRRDARHPLLAGLPAGVGDPARQARRRCGRDLEHRLELHAPGQPRPARDAAAVRRGAHAAVHARRPRSVESEPARVAVDPGDRRHGARRSPPRPISASARPARRSS